MNTTTTAHVPVTNSGALIGIWTDVGLWGIECPGNGGDCSCELCVYGQEMSAWYNEEHPNWEAELAAEAVEWALENARAAYPAECSCGRAGTCRFCTLQSGADRW